MCMYDPVAWSCVADPDYPAPFATFLIFVWIVAGLQLAKEAAKVACLLWFGCRGTGFPKQGRLFCQSSPLALVALLLDPHYFHQVLVMHEPSLLEEAWAIVYDGLCGDFIQMPLGLYFTLQVTKVGLSDTDVVSLFASGVGVLGSLSPLPRLIWRSLQRKDASEDTVMLDMRTDSSAAPEQDRESV